MTALAAYTTLREALHQSGAALPEDYVAREAPYYYVASDKSVFTVEKPGLIASIFTSPKRRYVAGPRAGQAESITSQQVQAHQREAEALWGRYVPGTIFTQPKFIPGAQRQTIPYVENGIPAGYIDQSGVHRYPHVQPGQIGG